MVVYFEKMVGRLNSGESMTIFRNISSIVGMTKSDEQNGGGVGGQKENFSVVPILQEQLCTSEFSKVILEATLWILHHRTMSLFWTVSSSSLTMLDMQSICVPSSIQGLIPGATDRPCSFCGSFGQRTQASWHDRVGSTAPCTSMRKAWKRHLNPMYWATSTLLWRKDWSIRHNRTPSSSTKHFQLIVSRKLFGWKLEKS